MVRLWDDLNDQYAPPEVVRELARMALAAMDSSESVELPLDYLHGHKDGLEWAAQLAEANHPETGDWLYDDPIELSKAIRKGRDMPPVQPVADSEPVAWTWNYREQWHVTNDERRAEFVAKDGDVAVLPLYRHAQSAQISEPVLPLQDKDLQGVIDALEHPAGINAAGKQVVRHALVEIQERRKADREPVAEVVSIYGDPEAFGEREIRPLVGIQQMPYGTKLYRHAQPAPVVPEEMTIRDACKFVQDMRLFDDVSVIVMRTWNACRAAMLRAQPQNAPQNIPEIIPNELIAAVNRLLDSNGSRGCYSAIKCYDAHIEVERLLAAAPQEVK
ncbi:hypothetical protein [Klebsiella variicola]|uniref:hypothetical protein n=1 Tax=Klebsiella variicola TaxID=244366 RepID=UPI003F49DA8C